MRRSISVFLVLLWLLQNVSSFTPAAFLRSFLSRNAEGAATSRSRLCMAEAANPTTGSVITVECCLRPEGDFVPETLFDGVCIDEFDPPKKLVFCLNDGNYLPGLHELVASMKEFGETQEASLDAGWGDRNPNLEADVSFDSVSFDPKQIKVGVQLVLQGGLKAVVTEVGDETFHIDANPPMAGASYQATVKLLKVEEGPKETVYPGEENPASRYEVATVACGCFWGVELEYMREPGVVGTKVGYTQGTKEDPTYKEVCSGTTGHTEALMIKYDPDVVSFDRLVNLAMDRLGENKYLLNQVGNDQGTQYRHGIYYHTDAQKAVAEEILKKYGDKCMTECLPAVKFWDAESYHQQYLLKGGQSAKKKDKSVIRCYG